MAAAAVAATAAGDAGDSGDAGSTGGSGTTVGAPAGTAGRGRNDSAAAEAGRVRAWLEAVSAFFRSDRGLFERLTSHNLAKHSLALYLQVPVAAVVAAAVCFLFCVTHAAAAGDGHSMRAWLSPPPQLPLSPTTSMGAPGGAATAVAAASGGRGRSGRLHAAAVAGHWTLLLRGLPADANTTEELKRRLSARYPDCIGRVELLYRGHVSEARLLRRKEAFQHRLEHLRSGLPDGGGTGVDVERLVPELEAQLAAVEAELDAFRRAPDADFAGCAFVTALNPATAAAMLEDFPRRGERLRRAVGAALTRTVVPFFRSTASRPGSGGGVSTTGYFTELPREAAVAAGGHTAATLSGAWRNGGGVGDRPTGPAFVLNDSPRGGSVPPLGGSSAPSTPTRSSPTPYPFPFDDLAGVRAERAPRSSDIIWANVSMPFWQRTIRSVSVQGIVFAMLILFTSPVAVLTAVRQMCTNAVLLSDPRALLSGSGGANESTLVSPATAAAPSADDAVALSQALLALFPNWITHSAVVRSLLLAYLPVVLLALVFAIVPSVLRATVALEGYPTHSAQEMSVFRKTSFYYVCNAVVLPSLALDTASSFLTMLYERSGRGENVVQALPILERLFSGDIAFFLCSYLVQLALSGSIFWLLQLPANTMAAWRRYRALTPLEAAEAKCKGAFDFPRHYAYNVTVMSMCLLFGCVAPLIWSFAVLYFVAKHAVDSFNLRYVFSRTHIDGALPRSSANFLLLWTVISVLTLAVIFYLEGSPIAAAMLVATAAAAVVFCLSASEVVGERLLPLVGRARGHLLLAIRRRVHSADAAAGRGGAADGGGGAGTAAAAAAGSIRGVSPSAAPYAPATDLYGGALPPVGGSAVLPASPPARPAVAASGALPPRRGLDGSSSSGGVGGGGRLPRSESDDGALLHPPSSSSSSSGPPP